jgi:hypothetical protein
MLAACVNWHPEAPHPNAHPTHFVTLTVTGFEIHRVLFGAEYATDVRLCSHMVRSGGPGSYYLLQPGSYVKDVPIVLTRVRSDIASGSFATDQFLPGPCGWRFKRVTYVDLDAPEYAVVASVSLMTDRIDPGGDPDAPLDLWCYQVTYQQKPERNCEPLVMLRYPNAPGEVSPEFLSAFSVAQQYDRGIRAMTQATTEINVTLHALNAIPGALISEGERGAQIARLKAEDAARESTPENKAYRCEVQKRSAYSDSHRPPPDQVTLSAAFAAFHQECWAEFGLPLSSPQHGK